MRRGGKRHLSDGATSCNRVVGRDDQDRDSHLGGDRRVRYFVDFGLDDTGIQEGGPVLTHTYETFLGPDLIKAIHNKRVGRGDYSGSYVFEVDFSEDGAPATLEAPESTAAVAPVTTALDPTVEDQLDSFVKDNLPESSPLREARDRGIPWPTIAIAAGLTAGASGRQAPAEADAERAG